MKRNHFLQLIIILAVLFCVPAAKAEPIPEAEASTGADEKGRLLADDHFASRTLP